MSWQTITQDISTNLKNTSPHGGMESLMDLKPSPHSVLVCVIHPRPPAFNHLVIFHYIGIQTGPRVCIGRKFATTEAVCFLTMLLRDWKVEPSLREGETKDAWRERVLQGKVVITLGVMDVPMRFTRRKR